MIICVCQGIVSRGLNDFKTISKEGFTTSFLLLLAEVVVATSDNVSLFIRSLKLAVGSHQYECRLCGHMTKDRSNLKNHVIYVHGNHDQEVCRFCNKVYKHKASLRIHLLRCTKKQAFNWIKTKYVSDKSCMLIC